MPFSFFTDDKIFEIKKNKVVKCQIALVYIIGVNWVTVMDVLNLNSMILYEKRF